MEQSSQSPNYLTDAEVKHECLKVLELFDRFCNNLNLRYSLAYGTLLGAIRHQGFIPWDDDIDVCMPRPDYERLLANADKLENLFGLHIVNVRGEEPYPIAFSKVINPSIQVKESNLAIPLEESLWIDVFPVDGIRMSNAEFKRLMRKHWNRMRVLGLGLHRSSSLLKETFRRMTCFFLPSPLKVAKAMDDALRPLDFDDALYVSDIAGSDPGKYMLLEKQSFLKTTPVLFEGKQFPAMSCWKEYLTSLYGDYGQLPPPDERISHGITAWQRTQISNRAIKNK